jgi:hypothetical protein
MFDSMHLYTHCEKGRRGFVVEPHGQENITSISSICYLLKAHAKNQFEVIIVRVELGGQDPAEREKEKVVIVMHRRSCQS